MLLVRNLFKNYENQPLLQGVSFNVNVGETVCLLGKSGSGKSTILRIISGIEEPESGEVYWENQNLEDIPVHQRHFSFMFQDYALFPHKNVFENVAFGLRMKNLPKDLIAEKVNEVLSKVKMSSFSHRRVGELSGGEQQRVALARSLAPEPRLLMLDEPLGALDRNLREQLMEELRQLLHESKIPTIYVTHDQEEAFTIGDQLLLLNEGKIVQSDTPENVYMKPKNIWVAKFFGLSNLITGTVLSEDPFVVNTEIGEMRITRDYLPAYKTDENLNLLLRPDSLMISEDKENGFEALIVDNVFLGKQWQAKVRIKDKELHFLIDTPLKIGNIYKISINNKKINIWSENNA